MKKIVFIMLVSLLVFACQDDEPNLETQLQLCEEDGGTFYGDAFLTSQEEVNQFGAMCYSVIDGSLRLYDKNEDEDKITDLTPLNSITQIISETDAINYSGSLLITTSILNSLNGLNNISKVSMLKINENDALITLSGLEGLVEITGNNHGHNMLQIKNNSILGNLNGLNNLQIVGKEDYSTNVRIENNEQLLNIDGLGNLTTIGGIDSEVHFDFPSIYVVYNNSLQNIDGFQNLQFVKGWMKFLYFHDVVGGNGIQVDGNDSLTDFCGLQNLLLNGTYSTHEVDGESVPTVVTQSDSYLGFGPSVQDIIDGNCAQ